MNDETIITNEQYRLMTPGQRAMVGARLAKIPPGVKKSECTEPVVTLTEAAVMVGLSKNTVMRARVILERGTPEMISAVEEGKIGIFTAYRDVCSPKSRKLQTGKNPTRLEKLKQRALVWKYLRAALVGLTSLPLPADVVPIAKRADRHTNLLHKLPGALAWLQEFNDVSNGQAAREERAAPAAAGSDTPAAGEGAV